MTVLITNTTPPLDRLIPKKSRNPDSIKIAQSMCSRHTCLCCSNPLIRHIHLGKLYWRCNHCYQAMPVIEDAKEIPVIEDAKELPLFVTHERLFQPLLISILLQEQLN